MGKRKVILVFRFPYLYRREGTATAASDRENASFLTGAIVFQKQPQIAFTYRILKMIPSFLELRRPD
jgi:hypothetical protein